MIHRVPMISGDAQLRSPPFSNRWTLSQNGVVIGRIKRIGRASVSIVDLGDRGRLLLEPDGDGQVRAVDEEGREVGRIVRRSWFGRRWDVVGEGYNYELISDRRPRRWHLTVANAPLATLSGSLVSYNSVDLHSGMAVPLPAVLLSWQVIARPWEAASEPRGLIAARNASLEPPSEPEPRPRIIRRPAPPTP